MRRGRLHILQTICLEREQGTHPDAEWLGATLESIDLQPFKPAPGRATLTFANLTFAQQDEIEGYAERLIEEAHALCRRLQARCPILRKGDYGELCDLERVYKAQCHAMTRLRRRCDDGL